MRWELHDYVSPGLTSASPDAGFPEVSAVDASKHPWPYLRREVPHTWYAHSRNPGIGVLNRDEAALLHSLALAVPGRALEIGSWIGWSTAHLALAGATVDAIEPAWRDEALRQEVERSLDACGVRERVRLVAGESPPAVDELAADGTRWRLFFVDGDHEGAGPARDVFACLPYAEPDCLFVFHDVVAPPVASAVRALRDQGFRIGLYQTAQVMAVAWRGAVEPVAHTPDPAVAWQLPAHLADLPFVTL